MCVTEVPEVFFQACGSLRNTVVTFDGAVEGLPLITDPVGVVGDIIRIGELRADGRKQDAGLMRGAKSTMYISVPKARRRKKH